jgi:hypothetical protein
MLCKVGVGGVGGVLPPPPHEARRPKQHDKAIHRRERLDTGLLRNAGTSRLNFGLCDVTGRVLTQQVLQD